MSLDPIESAIRQWVMGQNTVKNSQSKHRRRENLRKLLAKTCVKTEEGEPLCVYRGEHGITDDEGLHSRLNSLTFSSKSAANGYATNPNKRGEVAEQPRIFPAYLDIRKPLVNTPQDPFIEFSDLEAALGTTDAVDIFVRFERYIFDTDNWLSNIDPDGSIGSVSELARQYPEKMQLLYCQAYPILDDPDVISKARSKGFDGAIYMGSGETMDDVEYRVFNHHSVYFALSGQPASRRERIAEQDGLGVGS